MNRKIALISEHASPLATLGGVDSGGQNVYVGELAQHLGMQGYQVDIFTRWDNPRLPQIVEWSKHVRVVHIKAGPLAFVRKEDLLPHMREFTHNMLDFMHKQTQPYNLLHANFWMSGLVAAEIKKATDIPFVITFHALGKVRLVHQGKADQFPAARLEIEQRIVREADQIIAECPQDQQDLLDHYAADPRCITMIPCGVNTHQFSPIDRRLARMILNLDTNERIILQLGRIVPRKGIETVIQALAHLVHQQKTPARLLIVGGESDDPDPDKTPEIARLMDIARQLNVLEYITFVGRKGRDVLKHYYSAADVFVTTPWYEPFGMTPLESMACGTPVIGSKVGGVQFTVLDGETGYLVPPQHPQALSHRLHQLLTTPKLSQQFRQKALRRIEEHFTWPRVAASVAALYERVLATNAFETEGEAASFAVISNAFESAIRTIHQSSQLLKLPVISAAAALTAALKQGGKILVCGNGGSAAESQHFAAELVGRFLSNTRTALPVIALTADAAILSSIANDFGYEHVFARQVEAYGRPGDVLIGISTSGNSANVIEAFKMARKRGIQTIGLLGRGGGLALDYVDLPITVPSYETQRIQEMHLQIVHMLCEIVENLIVTQQAVAQPMVKVLPRRSRKILQVNIEEAT
jgi:D-inositol-3-phosphate glycosyltransferase